MISSLPVADLASVVRYWAYTETGQCEEAPALITAAYAHTDRRRNQKKVMQLLGGLGPLRGTGLGNLLSFLCSSTSGREVAGPADPGAVARCWPRQSQSEDDGFHP